jgi:hypothetical protein
MKLWMQGAKLFMAAAVAATLGASAARADDDPNRDLALRALAILGAPTVPATTNRCSSCHQVTVTRLNDWNNLTAMASWSCFSPDDPSNPVAPMTRIDCMRENASDPTSGFSPKKLGLYAAGAHLPYFSDLFQAAFPAAEWQQRYTEFKNAVSMPYNRVNLMTQADYDTMMAWYAAGMPFKEEIVGGAGAPPTSCTTEIKPELLAHVQAMATQGWAAKNRDAGLHMFGCPNGAAALGCFGMVDGTGQAVFPDVRQMAFGTAWANDMPESKIRVLRELPFYTSFWMRSSADGRFLANGAYDPNDDDGSWGARISDLAPQLTRAPYRDIKVDASYDPSFFPDNSGFVFQGTPVGTGMCRQSLLEDPATTTINFTDQPDACSGGSVSLYQAIGASLDGSDYLAITGGFAGDGGGGGPRQDGTPYWDVGSYAEVTPIVNDGQRFQTLDGISVFTPYLGDWGLSPSNVLTASRISGLDAEGGVTQMGFRFSFLDRTPTDSGYEASIREAGTICTHGGKGAFSYDERFFTTYHYVEAADYAEMGYASADDPAFQELIAQGSANVIIMDLATGKARRVTRMGPGQFALFPHFRSDGWIYFLVNDTVADKRYAAATDAAVLIEQAEPTP